MNKKIGRFFLFASLVLLSLTSLQILLPQQTLAATKGFYRKDASTIVSTGYFANEVEYKGNGSNYFAGNAISGFRCRPPNGLFEVQTRMRIENVTGTTGTHKDGGQCGMPDGAITIYASKAGLTAAPQRSDGTATGEGATGSQTPEGEEDNSCESKGGSFGWLSCPLINALSLGLNWFDEQIQALLAVDENKYTNDTLYKAWAQIRNLAYLILVPIMLVMVIGTAIGSGFFDAYTVKKALPRMVAAVIFIALSWYICGFLITFFNVIGGGILGILTNPFYPGGENMNLATLFDASTGTTVTQYVGGAGFLAALGGFIAIGGGGVLLSYLFIAFLTMAIAFLILTLRQIFIIALFLIAPLAILAWIFPGNDRLWKLWWGTFSKLLMMFPLIMAIIAVGRIFAYLVGNSGGAGAEGALLNPLLKLTAYIVPYLFIPFTFKFAGGMFATVAGVANDRSKGIFDRQKQKRAMGMERAGRKVVAKRADWQNRLQNQSSKRTGFNKFATKALSKGVGGYNIQAAASARQASVGKELGDQIATGRDEEIRGLTVNKKAATVENGLMRIGADGTREYKTLGGAWVTEGAVDAGKSRWGNDAYAQQAALSYEMRKASTDDEIQGVAERYQTLATSSRGDGGWGMNTNQATGALKGAGFENQNTHLEFKHMNLDGSVNGRAMAKEAYEKKGSYPLSQMSAHTFKRLGEAHAQAKASGDTETMHMVESTAETFMTRYGGGGRQVAATEDGAPIMAPPGPPEAGPAATRRGPQTPQEYAQQQSYQANSQGSGHVAEAARQLAVDVGVYRPLDPSTETHSAQGRGDNPRHN